MFGFLKDKLKSAVSKFTKKVEEEAEVVEETPKVGELKQASETDAKKHEASVKKTDVKEVPKSAISKTEKTSKKESKKPVIDEPEKPKSFFQKIFKKEPKIVTAISDSITKISLSESKFDDLFWDLEMAMLENNVAVEVIDKIKTDLKKEIVDRKVVKKDLEKIVLKTLKESLDGLFENNIDIVEEAKKKKPYVIVFIGINGSGKTTTLAKVVKLLQNNKMSCVVGACDTFRAAAIQQLEQHTKKLGVKLIKHDYGADPAAVAYDTVQHAKSKKLDVALIDTAGRLHSNKNLMDELKKIIKVVQPDMKIFVGESITGNDCVEQSKLFNDAVGIDGIILTKADIDEKGGAAVSVSYVTQKPILYLCTGQEYNDMEVFNKDKILANVGI